MESPTTNGVVLHLHFQLQDRKVSSHPDNGIIDALIAFSTDIITSNKGIISEVSDNAVIGIFLYADDEKTTPELKAASCANLIRNKVYEHRANKDLIVMTASINSGTLIIGSLKGENNHDVMGNAINASFQLINATQPMQISLTRRIKEKITSNFLTIERMPIVFGAKRATTFYLHHSI